MKEKNYKMFVATIKGDDVHFEADINAYEYENSNVRKMIERVIRETGMKTNRKNPQTVKIKIDVIKIKDGKQVRSPYSVVEITPPLEAMTEADFQQEQADILSELPQEFQSVFASMAWDRGHSAGYEEVISHLKGLVNELSSSINAFARRVSKTI